ncbi:hypothetical protein JKI95_02615 [Corynebacterium aquatimens]|uniref:hypothetical protein n=1 Tax=Corynebacterium TaxID=1716 RepID=UPI001F4353AC|nr:MULTISPECIES: hypothetical protein [Corynebacterium]QYH19970.1 hypothetical protein JKI95_02615 [Corynebacterium aquatimens]UIZ92847.1 hypothetical protein JZY91_03560 [Corynebacterium sp. CNCTC7651]
MRSFASRLSTFAFTATLALTLSSCSSQDMGSTREPGFTPVSAAPAKPDVDVRSLPAWIQAYDDALDHPDSYIPYPTVSYTPTGKYQYAVVEANGEGNPELLIRIGTEDFDPVVVLEYREVYPDGPEELVFSENRPLFAGYSEAMGTESRVEMSDPDSLVPGLFQMTRYNDETFSTYYLLGQEGSWKFYDVADPARTHKLQEKHYAIQWHDVNDRAPLYAGELTATQDNGPDTRNLQPGSGAVKAGPGEMLLEGEIRMLDAAQVQQETSGIFFDDDLASYYFLWLDSPTEIKGHQYGTPISGTSRYVYLGTASAAPFGEGRADGLNVQQLEGLRIKAVIAEDDVAYASDPRVPEDSPTCGKLTDFEVVG